MRKYFYKAEIFLNLTALMKPSSTCRMWPLFSESILSSSLRRWSITGSLNRSALSVSLRLCLELAKRSTHFLESQSLIGVIRNTTKQHPRYPHATSTQALQFKQPGRYLLCNVYGGVLARCVCAGALQRTVCIKLEFLYFKQRFTGSRLVPDEQPCAFHYFSHQSAKD